MPLLKRIIDFSTTALAVVAGVAVTLMMIHVASDVIFRVFFNKPPLGTIVFVSNYYMVFLVCLPLAFVERVNGHISVEVLSEKLPKRLSYHLYSWTYLISAAVFGIVAWAGWQEAIAQFKLGTFVMEQGVRIPIWHGYFAIPLGYGMAAIYLMLKFAAYLLGNPTAPTTSATDNIASVMYD